MTKQEIITLIMAIAFVTGLIAFISTEISNNDEEQIIVEQTEKTVEEAREARKMISEEIIEEFRTVFLYCKAKGLYYAGHYDGGVFRRADYTLRVLNACYNTTNYNDLNHSWIDYRRAVNAVRGLGDYTGKHYDIERKDWVEHP